MGTQQVFECTKFNERGVLFLPLRPDVLEQGLSVTGCFSVDPALRTGCTKTSQDSSSHARSEWSSFQCSPLMRSSLVLSIVKSSSVSSISLYTFLRFSSSLYVHSSSLCSLFKSLRSLFKSICSLFKSIFSCLISVSLSLTRPAENSSRVRRSVALR